MKKIPKCFFKKIKIKIVNFGVYIDHYVGLNTFQNVWFESLRTAHNNFYWISIPEIRAGKGL
jgi:hypothetical protein